MNYNYIFFRGFSGGGTQHPKMIMPHTVTNRFAKSFRVNAPRVVLLILCTPVDAKIVSRISAALDVAITARGRITRILRMLRVAGIHTSSAKHMLCIFLFGEAPGALEVLARLETALRGAASPEDKGIRGRSIPNSAPGGRAPVPRPFAVVRESPIPFLPDWV